MRISWKRLAVFGFEIALPVLTVVAYVIRDHQREVFRQVSREIAECTKCHRLMDIRAGLGLILHLRDVHKMDEDNAMMVVNELYHRILVRKYAKEKEQ